jgi:hypothetical protein
MNDADSTKSCIHCREPIQSGARRCPHCLAWQLKWFGDHHDPRYAAATLGVALLFLLLLFGALILLKGSRQPESASVFSEIQVIRERLTIGTGHLEGYVVVFGVLRNPTKSAFRDPYLHIDLRTADGTVVDTISDQQYDVFLPPQTEITFRVIGRLASNTTDSLKPAVKILWAWPVKEYTQAR